MHHTDLWIVEHMVVSAERAMEEGSLLDSIPKSVEFRVKVGP